MKLEVGMYVRTKYGIFKIRKITKDLAYWKHEKRVIELDRNIPECNYRFSFYKDESIFKGAKFKNRIIDLIEVGDYVNRLRVYGITDYGLEVYMFGDCKELLEEKEIESIVTKEQFESISYKIGA